MIENKFTFIDLFAGIGGFRMALERLGGDCLSFSEINSDAIKTYCENFTDSPENNLGDITKIKELPKHNLLTGGVPCQSWSIAGRNLGFDDDRGQLWNDTIYLLNQSKPDAFIFENVKGLVDPRNRKALTYILDRIKEAGYHANFHVLNSFDYGVPQNRIRIYIVGFLDRDYFLKFNTPKAIDKKIKLGDIITDFNQLIGTESEIFQKDLFGEVVKPRKWSLSTSNGFNDYFLFNDLRNGHSTVHSWDISATTERQKGICYLLLRNRRKNAYGNLDGNPLSLKHFQELDPTITQQELDDLKALNILQDEKYAFRIDKPNGSELTREEDFLLSRVNGNVFISDDLMINRDFKLNKISVSKTLDGLLGKGVISCIEVRYDFKHTKISTGLNGVNRIFLPTSNIFPTLVASDTNDFITTEAITAKNEHDYKRQFIEEVYNKGKYRRITKQEACLIQGFPPEFLLPERRARWMKLIGNSVSVPVVEMVGRAIIETGVFDKR